MDKNLIIRFFSAVTLVGIIFALYFFFKEQGLIAFSFFVITKGVIEYKKMILMKYLKAPTFVCIGFLAICIASLLVSLVYNPVTLPQLVLIFILFSILGISFQRNNKNLELILKEISYCFLGFLYTLVLPLFILKILSFSGTGLKLFVSLLFITFSGDVMAYFSGRFLGKRLVMPYISPKKTIAGSAGGFLASCLAGAFFLHLHWPLLDLHHSLIVGGCCGIAAQFGDFFESLIKRISGFKDSGSIMPGHGGALDRVDGLYFAAPVFYFLFSTFN